MENKPITENRQKSALSYNRIENVMGITGKVTPQAVEFEEAVLGALMMDSETVSEVLGMINHKMFYVEANQKIFQAIEKLFIAETPIDLLTVTNQLRNDKSLEIVGGPSYLAQLTNRVSSSANVQYHARIILEKYVVRELIKNCNSIITDAYDESNDVLTLMDNAETKIFNIIEQNFHRDSKPLHQVVQSAIKELREIRENKDDMQGVPSGIRAIDAKTGGWQKSDLIILAARPGMGKTSFVLSIARNAAIDNNRPVAFFSLEMSASQLVHRLFAIESGIDAEHIAKGNLNDEQWEKLVGSINRLESSNLIIDDTPALSIFDLRAKCRRLKHQHDIQMIIIDYLQLMSGNTDGKSGNREQEISHISRSLKALAKDLNVPVIALSQLSRAVENRANSKRPQLSDLRESGSIEQDADMVLFIYRPEYYKLDTFEDDTPSKGMAEIIFEKNRHGSPGPVKVRFQAQYTKFSDVEDGYFTGEESTYTDNQVNPAAVAQSFGAMQSMMAAITPNRSFEVLESSMNDDSDDINLDDINGGMPF